MAFRSKVEVWDEAGRPLDLIMANNSSLNRLIGSRELYGIIGRLYIG